MYNQPFRCNCYGATKILWFTKKQSRWNGWYFELVKIHLFLSEKLNIEASKIKSFVLGGHGDTMVAMLNHTKVDGEPIKNLVKSGKILEEDLNKIGR